MRPDVGGIKKGDTQWIYVRPDAKGITTAVVVSDAEAQQIYNSWYEKAPDIRTLAPGTVLVGHETPFPQELVSIFVERIDENEVILQNAEGHQTPKHAKHAKHAKHTNTERCVLMEGERPARWFRVFGPFDTPSDAIDYAENQKLGCWWTLPIVPVQCDDEGNWIT